MGEGEGGEALSLFRFRLSLFLPETPDTQARAKHGPFPVNFPRSYSRAKLIDR